MFFSSYMLTKKGALAKVWLAAHWEKKLTKQEVQVIDLSKYVLMIREPEVAISCRTQGELLLGCVRIYACKVSALRKESVDALVIRRPVAAPGPVVTGGEPEKREVNEKKVTMASGLQDLVAIQEIASFDVNEVFATSVDQLPVAEGFNIEEWWGNEPDLPVPFDSGSKKRSSLERGVHVAHTDDPDILDPVIPEYDRSSTGRGSVGGGVDATTAPLPSSPLLDTDTEPTTKNTPAPPPPKKVKTITVRDPETTLDPTTIKKWTANTSATTRKAVMLPSTEEELSMQQDKRFALDDIIVRPDPPKRRRIDITGLPTCHFIGDTEQSCSMFETAVNGGLDVIASELGQSHTPFRPSTRSPSDITRGGMPTPFTDEMEPLPIHPVSPVSRHLPTPPQQRVEAPTAGETLESLRGDLKRKQSITFGQLAEPGKAQRHEAAAKFMDLLVLSTKGHVNLEQAAPYADISVKKGEHFNRDLVVDLY
eukprot:TRINITY_DN7986_c0_g1_i1.p1 TRINITY_DN7986_c0_g1~~TRINITY_DN7986_c0_g1_i1.p1  ORF type:complete len:480 (+),score=137.63 TRINITY_DN7986_c0_g1_i1:56-1495(+)